MWDSELAVREWSWVCEMNTSREICILTNMLFQSIGVAVLFSFCETYIRCGCKHF